MAGRYYTDDQLRDIERARLFQSIIGVGTKDPYYALGLAIGNGLGNAMGDNAEERKVQKLNDYVNSNVGPSAQVELMDRAQKEIINPNVEKLAQNGAFNGDIGNAFGQPQQIPVQNQGFRGLTQADIIRKGQELGLKNSKINAQMPLYSGQIQNAADEYYGAEIERLLGNGVNQQTIPELARTLGNYGRYNPNGAKQLAGYMSIVDKLNNSGNGGITTLNRGIGRTKATQTRSVEDKAPYTDAQVQANDNLIAEYLNTPEDERTETMTHKYNLAMAENEKAMRWREDRAGIVRKQPQAEPSIDFDDYTNFQTQFPEEYEDKSYAELAKELGVLPNNIANLGRAEAQQQKPQEQKPAQETPKATFDTADIGGSIDALLKSGRTKDEIIKAINRSAIGEEEKKKIFDELNKR